MKHTYTQDEIDALMEDQEPRDECWNCGGEGFIDGDCTCGEDCCACLEPEPPICSVCKGKGYFQDDPPPPDNP